MTTPFLLFAKVVVNAMLVFGNLSSEISEVVFMVVVVVVERKRKLIIGFM